MIDLDARARSATDALKRSVIEADLALAEPPTVRQRRLRSMSPAFAMAAGAVTALVLLLGYWNLGPTIVADDVDTTTTTVAATTTTTATTVTTTPTTAPAVVPVAPPPPELVDVTPPSISITSPFEGEVFDVTHVTFAGTTEPGARVFGGPYEAKVGVDGTWSIVLILSEGPNLATFTAVDDAGNEASASVTAIYTPPTRETPPPKDPAPFVANATWFQSSAVPAYYEYYGTGEPGSVVKILSEWGSGETVVAADGSWYLKVFFPKAPNGVTFDVKIKDSLGRYVYFTMTATG